MSRALHRLNHLLDGPFNWLGYHPWKALLFVVLPMAWAAGRYGGLAI